MMKPKINRKGDKHKASPYDRCETPGYALDPLYPYLRGGTIWECASGSGMLVRELRKYDYHVIETEIDNGLDEDFFVVQPEHFDVILTNPPYSTKYAFLERAYEFGKPFALLMPVEMLGAKTSQWLFRKYGIQVIFMDKHIDFKMPEMGWLGSGAQFPVAWYTWGLGLPKEMNFVEIEKPPKCKLAELYD